MIIELLDDEVAEVLANPRTPLPVRLLLAVLGASDAEGNSRISRRELRDSLKRLDAEGNIIPVPCRELDRTINAGIRDGLYGPKSHVGRFGLVIGRRLDGGEPTQ